MDILTDKSLLDRMTASFERYKGIHDPFGLGSYEVLWKGWING